MNTKPCTITATPFDLYRDIHKAIRAAMFEVTVEAGRIDPSDRTARIAHANRVHELVDLLRQHALHEDAHIESVVASVLPAEAATIAADHAALERRMDDLIAIADLVFDVRCDARATMHHLYLELAAFVSAYLVHQDVEERVVMPALWNAFGFEPLLAIHNAIIESIPPDEMAAALTVMLPVLNNDDRTELLGGMQASAPREAFAGVCALASRVLTREDWLTVSNRLTASLVPVG